MYLLYSILSSTIIFIVFKLFPRFNIDRLQAIVVNYMVACFAGLFFYQHSFSYLEIVNQNWFPGALLLGFLFIAIFYLMALTTQRNGIAVVSVATKMSVVIPVAFGIVYFKDSLDAIKLLGIVLALLAVYLVSLKTDLGLGLDRKNLILPILVFMGSGIIDTSIKFLEETYIAQKDVPLFSAVIFAFAFVVGLVLLIFRFRKQPSKFDFKNILAGIALGLPNYFSIFFLVRALRNGWESSTVFLINNVGIVVLSTLIALLLFKEQMSRKNWFGLLLAIVGIILVSLSK
ncbi:EamA family transporter [Flavimarina sp. Hel_I_48]|uniref:EamA family transporter n=1 Tax=Flavimarina sp. Hel_I_48 TaxID=1392488 RepID=UPI0004DF08E3|nr:EamA family transporter [Flavimarina sp. Hel_I_48]